jgi:AcrR family transcriptional regulator
LLRRSCWAANLPPLANPLTRDAEADVSLWQDISPPSSQRLLLAALESFAERGFHGTTTRDIARRAKMSPAALYVHYPSKGALLFEISRAAHQAMLQEWRAAFAQEAGSSAERLANLIRAQVRFHATHHTAARVANYELHSLSATQANQIRVLRTEMGRVMREAVRLGVNSGDFAVSDLGATCVAIISLGVDTSRWFDPRGRLTPDEIGDLYAELGLRLVGYEAGRRSDGDRAGIRMTKSAHPSRPAHPKPRSRRGRTVPSP